MTSVVLAALLAVAPAPPPAPAALQQQVEATLARAGAGLRFGMVVARLDGSEVVAINPDARFVPASNTKLFTTLAAFELHPALGQPDVGGATSVRLEVRAGRRPDVILAGRGGARLSSAPDCRSNCLSTLADAVAAHSRTVGAVIGDARAFADERWSFGMSWNNIPTRSGTAIAALMLDDNEMALRVAPAAATGQAPRLLVADYVQIVNEAVTVAEGTTQLHVQRLPGERKLRLSGTMKADAGEQMLRLGIDDPAHYAAWRFTQMLKERGVRVSGEPSALYRPAGPGLLRRQQGTGTDRPLALVPPAPLAQQIVTINKASQNAEAELLLRRLGASQGNPSVAGGLEAVRIMLDQAGVPPRAASLADGSGMSPYNRASPRGLVTVLRWAAGRPWAADFRASLPIGGVDGTLASRFREGGLKGRIFAKTGSLTAANALSGYLLSVRGETLIFSIMANDVPEDVRATTYMDEALELVAASL